MILQTTAYELMLSAKRKTLSISITPNLKVKVRAPIRMSKTIIENFVNKKQSWISRKLHEFSSHCLQKINVFEDGGEFWLLGKSYKLHLFPGEDKNFIMLSGTEIEVHYTNKTNPEKFLEKCLKTKAAEVFKRRFDYGFNLFSRFHKCSKPPLSIRKMKARYGSFSVTKGVILNLKLIHVRPILMDYVIMHELCHIKHQDHSKNFYLLMEKVMPQWRSLKKELFKLTNIF
jgi:predicted metal-dependent hydrolase